MKKFLLAALAVLCLTPSAYAGGVLTIQPVNWVWQTNLGLGGVTDKKCLIGSSADTTAFVGTSGWYIPDYPVASDSVMVGRFIVAVDSTAAYTPPSSASTTTVTVQGSIGNSLNFITIASYSLKLTDGQKYYTVPIRISTSKFVNLESLGNWSGLAPNIRIILSHGNSFNAARCFVQYMKPVN